MRLKFAGDWLPKSSLSLDLKDDECFWVGNLECAFSDVVIGSGKAYTSLLPLGRIDNVSTCFFSALSLANNHVYDAGEPAFDWMVEQLHVQCPETQFFGTIEQPYADLSLGGRHIAVIGCLEPCRSRGVKIFKQEDVLALIRRIRDDFDFVYVFPHWGKEGEYTRYPAPWQLKLARRWIDDGADGVFGNHSHVPQGRETYKGKPIYYSLGNFDFDHPEGKLYAGTSDRLILEVNETGVQDFFDSDESRNAVEDASRYLLGCNLWNWARAVGPFNLRKNTASWKIRLRKNFLRTLPRFLIWQLLPQTLLFRVASCFGEKKAFV